LRKLFGILSGVVAAVVGVYAGLTLCDCMSDPPKTRPLLVFVMLREPQDLNAEALSSYAAKSWPNLKFYERSKTEGGLISFEGDGTELAAVSQIDVPFPVSELEYPCATALSWPDACDELGKTKAHLIVTVFGKGDALDDHLRASMLVQAAMSLTDAAGIYWSTADSVWSRDDFQTATETMSRDEFFLPLWVGLKSQNEADGTHSLFTRGMDAFGLMNIEVPHSIKDPADTLFRLGDIATYLIKNGPIIKDGDTLGQDSSERIRVTVGPSLQDETQNAYRLEY
jgi:hypothetical protein